MPSSSPLSTSTFMEYDQLKQLLDNTPPYHLYEELMSKEEKVLETINRVANIKEKDADAGVLKEYSGMPILDVIRNVATTNYDMFNDLMAAPTMRHFFSTFDARRIVDVGITVVAIAIFLFFINISS